MSHIIRKKIIFATGNEGKMKEIRMVLSDMDVEIVSLKEAGINKEIVENGSTFAENAIIKAKTIMEETGMITLADDSGLEIDYLNREPGIYSARYLGEDTPYSEKNKIIMERMQGVPDEKRTARFVCAIAAAFPDGTILTTEETVEGKIGYAEKGENGFGYDPIFYLPEFECTTAELSSALKNKISHRGKALSKMKAELISTGKLNQYKILIVSDSHRQNKNLYRVIEKEKPLDLLIHCGDMESDAFALSAMAECPVEVVGGNNDLFYRYEKERVFDLGKHRVYLTHGHRHGVYYSNEKLKEAGCKVGADIVISGHTHVPSIKYDNELTLLNPGSITYPRQEGKRPSYIMMEIDRRGETHFTIKFS